MARDGAWASELTGQVNLPDWPEGTRLICRRERPHPGAQLSFSDHDGSRFQCFITDQTDPDIAVLEATQRQHAVVEDRVKPSKPPAPVLAFHSFQANAAWPELALIAYEEVELTTTWLRAPPGAAGRVDRRGVRGGCATPRLPSAHLRSLRSSPGNPGAIPSTRRSNPGDSSNTRLLLFWLALLLVVIGMNVSFVRAYTDPRTTPGHSLKGLGWRA